MTVNEFIDALPPDRQSTITALHQTILANDAGITCEIKPMMGKDMILYEQFCYMKYALASVKSHMSLHCLPMYMQPALHAKYEALLPAAKFQKGCINFTETVLENRKGAKK